MELEIYDYANRHVYVSHDEESEFAHTRGGSAEQTWLRNSGLKIPFDLLFTLDLSDPRIGIQIPSADRLPLLYGLNYMDYSGYQSYRIVDSNTVELLDQKYLRPNEDAKLEVSKEVSVQFRNRNLDMSKAEDALSMLQVFGLNDLSESELERALEIAYSDEYNLSIYEDCEVYREGNKKAYLEIYGTLPFFQGSPSDKCDFPDCPSVTYLRTGWIPFPVRGWLRPLFRRGHWEWASDVERASTVRVLAVYEVEHFLVVFSYCNECHTVFVENQAT